jgi:hypothetical protein
MIWFLSRFKNYYSLCIIVCWEHKFMLLPILCVIADRSPSSVTRYWTQTLARHTQKMKLWTFVYSILYYQQLVVLISHLHWLIFVMENWMNFCSRWQLHSSSNFLNLINYRKQTKISYTAFLVLLNDTVLSICLEIHQEFVECL